MSTEPANEPTTPINTEMPSMHIQEDTRLGSSPSVIESTGAKSQQEMEAELANSTNPAVPKPAGAPGTGQKNESKGASTTKEKRPWTTWGRDIIFCLTLGAFVLYALSVAWLNPSTREAIAVFFVTIAATQLGGLYFKQILIDHIRQKTTTFDAYPVPLKEVLETRRREMDDPNHAKAAEAFVAFLNQIAAVWALYLLIAGRSLILAIGASEHKDNTLWIIAYGTLLLVFLLAILPLTLGKIGHERLDRHYSHDSFYPPLNCLSSYLRFLLLAIFFAASIVPIGVPFSSLVVHPIQVLVTALKRINPVRPGADSGKPRSGNGAATPTGSHSLRSSKSRH